MLLHRKPERSRRRRGFTLTETIAAIVVLGVGIPPLLWTVREAHMHRANPRLYSTARWLASAKLEDVIADRHSSTRGYAYLDSANYADETPVAGFTGFDRTVTFTETEADLATPGTGYMTVDVAVSFTDAEGASRTLTISTVLTEYAP